MENVGMRKRSWVALLAVAFAFFVALALAGCSGAGDSAGSGSSVPAALDSSVLSVDEMADSTTDFSKYEESRDKATEDGSGSGGEAAAGGGVQDQYQTDPVPEGMPEPVEPEDTEVDESNTKTCYLTVSCATVLNHMDWLAPGKESVVPSDGVIFARTAVTFYDGESVFDVLKREMRNARIHLEYSSNPAFNSAYIEGINNLYEFDCGGSSGWMYSVNGWYPNYGVSRYAVEEGDEIALNYTCDLGADLGA